jgi:hypothetical protein
MAKKKPRDKASEQIITSAERRRRRLAKQVQGPSSEKLKQGAPGTYKLKKEDQSSREEAAKGKLKYKSKVKTLEVGPRKVQSKTVKKPVFGDPELQVQRTESKQQLPGGGYKQKETEKVYDGKETGYSGKYAKRPGKGVVGYKSESKKIGASKDPATIATEIGYINPDVLTKVKRKGKMDREKGYVAKGKEVVKKKTFAAPAMTKGVKRKVDKAKTETLSKGDDKYIRKRDVKTITKGGKEKTVTKISREKNPDYLTARDRRKSQKKKKNTKTAYRQYRPGRNR